MHDDLLVRFDLFEWLGFKYKLESIVHIVNQTANALVARLLRRNALTQTRKHHKCLKYVDNMPCVLQIGPSTPFSYKDGSE
jgi:hypothetical protein